MYNLSQKNDVAQREAEAIGSLLNHILNQNISKDEIAVSFSGGKDSLVALDFAQRIGIKKAVYCDTTIDFDETKKYIKLIENFYDVDLVTVRSELDFFDTVEKIGFPSRRSRWCCDVFKFAPITKYGIKNNIKMFITGLRKDESTRRHFYDVIDKNPLMPFIQCNPFLEWTDNDIWNYIRNYNLPYNPLYDQGFKRLGCWCCPYKPSYEWDIIQDKYPSKMKLLKERLIDQSYKDKINDKNKFIDDKGWSSWISPVRKISIGSITSCPDKKWKEMEVLLVNFNGNNEMYNKRIIKILPIITDLFWIQKDNTIKIIIDKSKKKKLKMLIEKAINCISCGVCLSLCDKGALKKDEISLYVDEQRCNQCISCLNGNSKILRGSCIVRNYNGKASIIIEV